MVFEALDPAQRIRLRRAGSLGVRELLRPTRFFAGVTGALLLAGCAADPLAGIKKLDEVDVVAPAPVVEAVAAPIETDQKATLFQRLMRKRQVAPDAAQAPAEAVAPTEAPAPTQKPAQDPVANTVKTPEPPVASQAGAEVKTPLAEGAGATEPVAAPKEEKPKRGWLFGGRKAKQTPDVTLAEPQKLDVQVEKVALTPEPEEASGGGGGLFSKRKAARLTGPDAKAAVPGEVLPFGEVARACHVKRKSMGKEVAKYPERGPKYRVYNSAAGAGGVNTFYITGFKDGCPRQVTAALAVFGTASMYEALRFSLPAKARSKKSTDKAYEKVKSRICGVGRNKPCGAKVSKVEKNTVFLSLYNRFEGARGWTNLLLSDGKLLAKDVEG